MVPECEVTHPAVKVKGSAHAVLELGHHVLTLFYADAQFWREENIKSQVTAQTLHYPPPHRL